MSAATSLGRPIRANPVWLAVPLVIGALIALTVGLAARQTVREPYMVPFFHPFFIDTLHMKAWLVTLSLLGSAFYGAVVAKVLVVRSTRFAPWVLPVAGGLLFAIILGLWLTSALWFFTARTA
jgi:hypothetical protein